MLLINNSGGKRGNFCPFISFNRFSLRDFIGQNLARLFPFAHSFAPFREVKPIIVTVVSNHGGSIRERFQQQTTR